MQIPCTITREQFADTDLAGRPYTLEFVHYAHAQTGERVRTKAHIIPALPARARNMKARRECKANDREAPAQSRGNVYLDARQNPAIRHGSGVEVREIVGAYTRADGGSGQGVVTAG